MKQTKLAELVETHNLALALERSNKRGDWRRALYHAVQLARVDGYDLQKRLREALQLP